MFLFCIHPTAFSCLLWLYTSASWKVPSPAPTQMVAHSLHPSLLFFPPSQAVSLSPSASPLTLSPHSLSLSLHLNTLVPCSSPSPLLLHSSVTHLFRLSLGTISTIGDPHCICVLPGGRTPRSHHFHPGEFHAGSAAPSQAEHRAEDPGGSCCGGHAGPGSGRPHPCVGQLCWHRWYR